MSKSPHVDGIIVGMLQCGRRRVYWVVKDPKTYTRYYVDAEGERTFSLPKCPGDMWSVYSAAFAPPGVDATLWVCDVDSIREYVTR